MEFIFLRQKTRFRKYMDGLKRKHCLFTNLLNEVTEWRSGDGTTRAWKNLKFYLVNRRPLAEKDLREDWKTGTITEINPLRRATYKVRLLLLSSTNSIDIFQEYLTNLRKYVFMFPLFVNNMLVNHVLYTLNMRLLCVYSRVLFAFWQTSRDYAKGIRITRASSVYKRYRLIYILPYISRESL